MKKSFSSVIDYVTDDACTKLETFLRSKVDANDGEVLLKIFEELGLHIWFRYEKYREEFSHDDVIVAIDETPVGIFVEIEGCERGIENAAAALGRSQADYILDSYRSLFLQHREAYGLDTSDMVFGTEAALLRAAASD